MTMRLSIISLAGMARTLVAVGTSSDADMFLTTAAAAPRSTCTSSPSAPVRPSPGLGRRAGSASPGLRRRRVLRLLGGFAAGLAAASRLGFAGAFCVGAGSAAFDVPLLFGGGAGAGSGGLAGADDRAGVGPLPPEVAAPVVGSGE